MTGGNVIPMFNPPTLAPNLSNDQKQVFSEKMSQRPPQQTNQPTISFSYTEPKKPMSNAPKISLTGDKSVNPMQFAPVAQYGPIMPYGYFNPVLNPMIQQMPSSVIVKNTVLPVPMGINDETLKLAMLYEDEMPSRNGMTTFSTLGERVKDFEFIRSTLFNNTDGNNVDISGHSSISLANKMKFDTYDINPYNKFKSLTSKTMGLPYGFLLFRGGYPVKYNNELARVELVRDAVSLNIRLYKLVEGAYDVKYNKTSKNENTKKLSEYNEWREIMFYSYIKDYILKKKVCPHFCMLYGYFLSTSANIDYDKIKNLEKKNEPLYSVNTIPTTNTKKNDDVAFINPHLKLDLGTNYDPYATDPRKPISEQYPKLGLPTQQETVIPKKQQENSKDYEINPNAYKGKSLVAITESPTSSLLGWASKVYIDGGNRLEMVQRGYHDVKTWKNILFQIMVGLYVMQKHKIYINNFDNELNIYVKDISSKGKITEFWKYVIDGVEYYLPNLGYVVIIDTNFNDHETVEKSEFFENDTTTYKLGAEFFGNKENINDKCFDMFVRAFDNNIFKKHNNEFGVIQPPTEIMSLMEEIFREASTDKSKNIGNYILKYMTNYIHNRVGTFLKENEIANIRKDGIQNLKSGNILIHEVSNNTYKFVLLHNIHDNEATILTKENNNDSDFIIQKININELANYVKSETIMQNFKPDEENLSDDALLEIYLI